MNEKTITKFKPIFLQDLVNFLYEDQPLAVRDFKIKELLSHDTNKGFFWKRVLAKAMPHTVLLERNSWFRDYSDGSDAKFAVAGHYAKGPLVATIHKQNKIGPLRVCICVPGQFSHRVYFMLIPYEYHSKLNPDSPIKITMKNFTPYGEIWDRFRCSWEEVTKPI